MIYFGVVEERISDPFKIGRCRVRVFGLHSEDKSQLPTQDLPWAMPLQSVTSAGISGVGHTPMGIVEGSWVAVVFSDEYKQQPVIIGVLGAVPFKSPDGTNQGVVEQQPVLTDTHGTVVTDSSGNPIRTTGDVLSPNEMTHSGAGEFWLMDEEALSSLTPGRNDFRKNHSGIPEDTKIYSYLDSANPPKWTIGWGSTYLEDGKSRVTASTVRTKAECRALLKAHVGREVLPYIRKKLSAPVTQSMYDALVSMTYNIGPRVFKTPFFSALNSGRYDEASALIPVTYEKGLANRRAAERRLFDSEGWPGLADKAQPTPEQVIEKEKDFPTPRRGTYTETSSKGDGFKDPNGTYPKYLNEPDTNRLARAENINETIVSRKDAARIKEVKTATGKTWRQPPVPYNSTYPFNHVRMTESGHVVEFDDTKNNERIHTYHKSGTFEEIDVNGTKTTRIVGDSYQIFDRDGNIYIQGNCNLTIVGDANIRVENNATMQVLGSMKTEVTGSYTVLSKGDITFKTNGKFQLQSDEDTTIQASNVKLNCDDYIEIPMPTEEAEGAIDLPKLTTPTRKAMFNANYETPEEGSNSVFMARNAREFDEDEKVPVEGKPSDEATPETKPPAPVSGTCDNLTDADIKPQYQLSTLFTLGDVLTGSSGYPSGKNFGLTASQIVCNLKKLSINCLDPIKAKYPNMRITNTWRSEAVNNRVGGSKKSDHLLGAAADIQLSGFNRENHYKAIIEIQKLLPAFKQLILEYKGQSTWIHVSFLEGSNSNQCLTIDAAINKTIGQGKFVLVS